MSSNHIWTTEAFTPAPAGWRIRYDVVNTPGKAEAYELPLPGWLTQENQHGARRVVPAWQKDNGGALVPAEDPYGDVLPVAGPGQARPDDVKQVQA